jgi:hypothetical protein
MPGPESLSPDREGYGGSSRNPARQMIEAAAFESGPTVKTVH